MTAMFARPKTLDEALTILAADPEKWTPIHGGTDVLVRVRLGMLKAKGYLDLSAIEDLKDFRVEDGFVFIGAGASHAEVAASELIKQHGRALAEAASSIGSPQIRNRGTLGGNIVNASPAADTVPPLFVLGAEVCLRSVNGLRWVAIEEFATGPGSTVRRADELLVAVRFPARGSAYRSRFARLGNRKALAIAKVSVAIGAEVREDDRLSGVRVALGAVAPTVIRARETERILEGSRVDEDVVVSACEAIKKEARPIDDIRSTEEYRREMCGVLLKRLLCHLV